MFRIETLFGYKGNYGANKDRSGPPDRRVQVQENLLNETKNLMLNLY